MKDIINFYTKFVELENVLRKGWLMRRVPVDRKESDADHTLQTILLANLIIKRYDIKELSIEKVMEMLLIHEIGEIVIGDISMIEPDYIEKKKKEITAVNEILKLLDEKLANYYFSLWQEFEAQETNEAQFCYFIDKYDAVIKAKFYDDKFNKNEYLQEFYNHALENLKKNNNIYLKYFSIDTKIK